MATLQAIGLGGHRAGGIHGGRPEPTARRRTAVLLLIGSLALAVGLLVYLCDRPASRAQMIPAVAALSGRHWFGAMGQWLPSLVHPLAFGLFSAALLPPRRGWRYGACGFWFGINAVFELGQHPQVSGPLVGLLQRGLGQGPVSQAVQHYLLRGRFDIADLAAAAAGAVLAAVLLWLLCDQLENPHAP